MSDETPEGPSDTIWPGVWQSMWLRGVLGLGGAVALILDLGLPGHPYFGFQELPFFDVLFGAGVGLLGLAAAFLLYLVLWRAEAYDDD